MGCPGIDAAAGRPEASLASSDADGEIEDWFPGRWDPRRRIHADLEPLVRAVGEAAQSAGWWVRGRGECIDAALVVGVDLHGRGPAASFAGGLERARGGQGRLRPADFVHSLPSTPAATLGLLFGFGPRQVSVATLGLAGFDALAYGCDLLAADLVPRVLVAALTVVHDEALLPPAPGATSRPAPPAATFRLALAACLEARGPDVEVPGLDAWGTDPRPDPGAAGVLESSSVLEDVPAPYRGLAAPGLLAAARALAAPGAGVLTHRDVFTGAVAHLRALGQPSAPGEGKI